MTEVASLLPPNHTLTSVRHYPAGPPPGLDLVEPGETFATTKEEEWVSKKKTEVLNTKQIETRVKRQVVLEDGKLVEDSGPIVTTNTTEDTETQKHHQTELRKLGDDDKMGAGGPLPLDGATSSNVLEKGNWIACPNPDGVVREVTEKRVVSREETEEVKEMEDIQHFGDITDEDFLKAVQSGRKDLRHVLRSSDQGRNIVSTGPRLVHESTKSKKVTDTESKRDLSSLQKDGKIVTESQRTTEHEEVTDDPLAEDAPDQDLYKESSERFLKTRDQEDVDYLQNGVNIGHEMRFRTEAMEVERKGEGLGLDDPDFESLSTRLRKRNASRQPQKYRETPAAAAESPLDRKDALTKRPIDFDHEELTRKVETSKWLDHHFGSDSKSSTASTIDEEEKPPKTSFFNVTIKSQSPVGGDRASPRGDRVSPRGERVSPKGYSPGHPQGYSRTSPVLYSHHQAERDEHQQGFYKGISEWTERRQEHVTEQTSSPLPYTRASPIDRQRSPLPDYRDTTTPIKYREDISPSPVYNRDIKESSYYYRENKENSRSRDNLRDKYERDTYRDIRDNRDIRDKSPQPNLRATPSKSRERLNYKETRQFRDTSHFRNNTRDNRDNIRDMDDSFRDRQRRQSPEYYIESPVAYKRDISHNFRDKSRDNYSSMERHSRAVREKKSYRGDYSPERGASPIPPQRRKSEKSRLGEEKRYRSVSREDVRMEEPPPDYAGPPSPPPMPPKDDRKVLQKTRFAAEPAKNKSGNIIGQSIRKLVGKIRSVSAERKAKQRAKRSPSPPSYQQGHIIDSNIGKEVINTSTISSPREFLTGRDEVDLPEMESEISSKPTVQKYYLGEDPFGGSIYGRENKYDGVKPVRISRRTREDEPRTQSSLGGRFSKSSSRLVTTTEDHVSQTLPRRSSHLENNANDSVPTRLAKNGHESTINVSFVNTLSQNNNISAPIKPARTYKTNLSRSKSFNVNSFDLNNSKMYQSNPHLNRLDANVGGLKSPGLISNLSKSQKDLFNHEESTTNQTSKRIFLKGLKDKAPELFKTLHEDSEETSVKPQTHYNNIYEPPTRLKRTPSPTNALRRRGSLSSDYSETYHTTTRSDNPYHPSVTNTTKTISKKTIPSKDGRSLETIESSELKSVTKSSKKPQYLRAVSPQLVNVRESTLKGSNLRENGIRSSNLRESNVRGSNVRESNVRERESKVTYFEERNKYGGSRYSSPSPVVIEVRNNHWK